MEQVKTIENTSVNPNELFEARQSVIEKIKNRDSFTRQVGSVEEAYVVDFEPTSGRITFKILLPSGQIGVLNLSQSEASTTKQEGEKFLESVGGSIDPIDSYMEDVPVVYTEDDEWKIVYGPDSDSYYTITDSNLYGTSNTGEPSTSELFELFRVISSLLLTGSILTYFFVHLLGASLFMLIFYVFLFLFLAPFVFLLFSTIFDAIGAVYVTTYDVTVQEFDEKTEKQDDFVKEEQVETRETENGPE